MKTLAEFAREKDQMFIRGLLLGLVVGQSEDKEYVDSWFKKVEEEYAN